MIKRFSLALAVSAAVLVLLPSAALAVWHSEAATNSSRWQNPDGAANVTCWARVTYDVSDSHANVYRLTKLEVRQTKNAGNVYTHGRIRGYICAHDYNTATGGHGVPTYEHNWPGGGAWETVPMQRDMSSGFIYPFSIAMGDWGAGSDWASWHYIDGCNWMGVTERFRLEAKFDIRASSDGRFLKTVSVNVQPGL